MHNPVFCSASTSEAKYRQILDIKAKSSLAVPLVIVPLQLGSHNIEVKAAVQDSFVSDGMKKKLKVVPEGLRMTKTIMSVLLDPSTKGAGGVQEVKVKAADIDDMVPDTESETKVSIQGNLVTMIAENSIDGANLKHLIVTPSGSGEENMIGMTAPVIATIYLDSTEQWERIGVERRAEAIKLIMQGYTQQMAYKKPDFSYSAFKARPSSTWLTAYVVKVFAMAKKLVPIENQVICGAVKWLILEKQKLDGVFQEDAPVIRGEMVGGYKGAEPDVSLTAFVLIALEEAKDICKDQVNRLEVSIGKAGDYLAQRYQSLTRPYTVALASYALAMEGTLDTEKTLMKASTGGNRWEERNARTFNIEGTSYALLALLKMKKYELAGPIVRWLREQNYYGGGYGSTQATIMVFQALAQYQIDIPQHKDLNLIVSIFLTHHSRPIKYRISNEDALVARTAELKWNEDFTVKAEGTGQATVTVTIIYNAKRKEDESQCKKFDLRVSVEEAQGVKKPDGAMRSVYIKICIRAPEATVSGPPPSSLVEEPLPPVVAEHPTDAEASQRMDEPPPEALIQGLSSSSSPDEAVAGASTSGPPPIDLRAHQDLLRRVAQSINLPVEEVAEDDDPVTTIIGAEAPLRVALPFIRTIQRNANTVWQSPASIPPTARGVERKYSVPPNGYEYLYTPPPPDSLVVQSVNDRERHGQPAPAPKSKEAQRMDLLVRKVYLAGGLQLRIANQLALLSRYTYDTLVSLSKFTELRRSFRQQPYRQFNQVGPWPDNRRRGRVNRRRPSGNRGNQSQAPSKPPQGPKQAF
ncbi:A.superbus venom factor 1-like [Mauremys mutica]|uniref:A.superbus venom factor 1-like n=1 Tax=Mauremys mutica TaxID=74926 RepID=UPI001D16AA57|nr:A.superbus venom factor 1-like [Mauremys mutica]